MAVVVNTEEGSSDIYIWDFNSGNIDPLTFNGNSTDPLWTPDGKRIVFVAGEGDNRGIYYKNANGTGKEEPLALRSDAGGPPWSWADDDGKTLVTTKSPFRQGFMGRGAQTASMMLMMGGGRGRGSAPKRAAGFERSSSSEETVVSVDIGTLSMEGEHEWNQLLSIKGWVLALQISPDGRWIAYNSSESDQPEVYVRAFPDMDSGGKWQVSTGYALGCSWSPIGRELFYVNREDFSLKAVEVGTEPTFKKGKIETLLNPRDIGLARGLTGFDISQDGKRFLMLKEVETAEDVSQAKRPTFEAPRKIIVVTNWFEELKKKVPVD